MNSISRICVLASAIAVSFGLQAGEVPNTEAMQGLQFNFSPPGARSLGMGGAFLGRADDATAAYANPAGLTNLFSPEISAEYRNLDYTTSYTSGGTYPSVTRATADSSANNLSYLSFVFPRDKFVFAVYRQQFMDFNTAFNTGQIPLPPTTSTALPTMNRIDMDIANYGISVAFRLNDRASLGASISYYDFSLDGSTIRDQLASSGGGEANRQVQSGSDNDWGINLGALFRLSDRISMGLVYRTAPSFSVSHTHTLAGQTTPLFSRVYDLEVPDMYGIGFSFQPSDNLTINLDITRINYSNLASPAFWAFGASPTSSQQQAVSQLFIDDGTEYHLGLEYVLSNKPIALRAGVWQDPDHSLKFQGPASPSDDVWQLVHDSFFKGGSDETHYSVGFGVFFTRFQVDVAADFSDIQDTISVSGVLRFE